MKKYVLVPYDEYHNTRFESQSKPLRLNIETILSTIPKNIKHKAKAILDHIINSGSLDWNDKGEIIIDQSTLNNTHITDLIKSNFYTYKNFSPLGYSQFRSALEKSNLPQSLLQRGEGLTSKHTEGLPPPGVPLKEKEENTKTWVWHKM